MVPLIPTVTAVLLAFFFFINLIIKKNGKNIGRRPPPGPPRLPVIGNMHQLMLGGGLPHAVLRDLARKHGPDLMKVKLGELDLLIASSSDAAREIFKTHDVTFADRPKFMATTILTFGNNDIGFAPYGEYWRQLRKICVVELLSARRVKSSFDLRKEEILKFVGDVAAKARSSDQHSTVVNVSKDLLMLTNLTTAKIAFGFECGQAERFVRAGKEMFALTSGFNMADFFPSLPFIDLMTGTRSKLMSFHNDMDEILGDIIDEHRGRRAARPPRDDQEAGDFVDLLLNLQEKGDLGFDITTTNIKAVIFDMFLGGIEPPSTAMDWAMSELARHPQVMKKVQAEIRQVLEGKASIEISDLDKMHQLKLAIKESLRLHPPFALLTPRSCRESCTVMGYDVPVGSTVFVNSWAIGRDPDLWEDSESFRPERFSGRSVDSAGDGFDFVPFGGGKRRCAAERFALASMELVLSLLLFYFDWEVPGNVKPEDLDMTEAIGATICRKSDLCLVAKPYHLSLPVG